MEKLKLIINKFRYADLTAQEMKMCQPEVQKRNVHSLEAIILILIALLLILQFFSFIPNSGEEGNKLFYAVFLGLSVIQYVVYRCFFRKNPQYILIPSYVFILTALAFGIYEATLMGADASSTALCVFMVAVPLLVIDTPLRLSLLILFTEAVLLIAHTIIGNPVGDRFVVVNSLACTFLSIFCCYLIQKTKYSDIRNHLMLEVQRDTDLMTGARSRVAYIRDLDIMSGSGTSAGVIFADVNGLKKTNDNLGHEAGDKLIKDAFNLMLRYFHGENDSIYRIGGDEFVIINIGDDENSFNARFLAMSEDDANKDIISCGCAWLKEIHDTDSAIKEAERLMYASKGRFYASHPEKDRRLR